MYHVIGLEQTRDIKNVTLKAVKKFVGVAVYWEELYILQRTQLFLLNLYLLFLCSPAIKVCWKIERFKLN